jgi:hypothetical protein
MSVEHYYVISDITRYGKVVKDGYPEKPLFQDDATNARVVAKLLNEETAPLLEIIAAQANRMNELEAQNRELLRERHALGIQVETLQMDDSIANDAIEGLAAENERYKAAYRFIHDALSKKVEGE